LLRKHDDEAAALINHDQSESQYETQRECLQEDDGVPHGCVEEQDEFSTQAAPKKHGWLAAIAFAALTSALVLTDVDPNDVLPGFDQLQLSMLLDDIDYTMLMMIELGRIIELSHHLMHFQPPV